jgi:hypothetical protein
VSLAFVIALTSAGISLAGKEITGMWSNIDRQVLQALAEAGL